MKLKPEIFCTNIRKELQQTNDGRTSNDQIQRATTSKGYYTDMPSPTKADNEINSPSPSNQMPTRAKSATLQSQMKKEKDYENWFYSSSWRVHSELCPYEIDRKKPYDSRQTFFYSVRKKKPSTFIFHPDWV